MSPSFAGPMTIRYSIYIYMSMSMSMSMMSTSMGLIVAWPVAEQAEPGGRSSCTGARRGGGESGAFAAGCAVGLWALEERWVVFGTPWSTG